MAELIYQIQNFLALQALKVGSTTVSTHLPTACARKMAKRLRYDEDPIGPELKFFDTVQVHDIDQTPAVTVNGQICLVPQGSTESERIGRQIIIRSIHCIWDMRYTPGAVTTGTVVTYMWLVLDKQANGAAAAFTDVFSSANAQQAFHNLNNVSRFEILKKWTHAYNSDAEVSGAFSSKCKFEEFFMECYIPIDYSSTTGAITEIRSNNIFILSGSSTNVVGDDLVRVNGNVRIRYQG